jgi:hypothetical protein
MVLAIAALVLAMAFGVLLALIIGELRRRHRVSHLEPNARATPVKTHTAEEIERRQSLIRQLIDLYSGVHSVEALSSFLNGELERRHEPWRVRIPADGPGEFYDLDP